MLRRRQLTQPDCRSFYGHRRTDNRKFLSSFSNWSNSSLLPHPLTYASAKRSGLGVGKSFSTTLPWRPFPFPEGVSGSCNASQQQRHVSFEAKGRKLVAMRFNLDAFRPHKIERTHLTVIPYMTDTLKKKSVKVSQFFLSDYLFTYLLTYSMEQYPSWEANWLSTSQEIPRILWNPKVHYRIYKCPSPVPILSQLYPVQTSAFHFLKIHLNIILSTSKWSLSFKFPQQNPI
jgi:hypothetical protein